MFICGFLLDIEVKGDHCRWQDFVVGMEHLFIRNIYREEELEKMENITDICSYRECFEKLIELIPILENALENPHWIREKEKLKISCAVILMTSTYT